MHEIVPISLNLHFTPNTSNCYGLTQKIVSLILILRLIFHATLPKLDVKELPPPKFNYSICVVKSGLNLTRSTLATYQRVIKLIFIAKQYESIYINKIIIMRGRHVYGNYR